MTTFNIKKGLSLPLKGKPEQRIDTQVKTVKELAILGPDYVGMKPTMLVKEGDQVTGGQVLFTDKKTEGVKYTAPVAGTVKAINRGDRRVFLSLILEVNANGDAHSFNSYQRSEIASLSAETIKNQLLDSGLWTAIRQRPFDKVANPAISPSSIFVTAMDSEPLAAEAGLIIKENENAFEDGLSALTQLTEGPVHVCRSPKTRIPGGEIEKVQIHEFKGKHPAGLPGTHIHYIDPVNRKKAVWHIGFQDVIAIGKLFTSGKIDAERIIAIAGPRAKSPRLVKTLLGARISEIIAGESNDSEKNLGLRAVSGSVLDGHKASESLDFLGRYHRQVALVDEDDSRPFQGWNDPGLDRFSTKNIYLSGLMPKKQFNIGTSTSGDLRPIVPVGSYEAVIPLDILPTQLFKYMSAGDTDRSEELGALELSESDLSLATFVDPCKNDFGTLLRDTLTQIEKEG